MALHRLGRRLLRICAIDPHGRLLTFYGAQGHRDSLILAAEFITSLGEGGGRRPEGANLATARNISDYIRLSPPPPAGGAPPRGGQDYSSILKYASVTEKGRPKKAIIP